MRITDWSFGTRNESECIAQFGQARLVKWPDGRYELRGGTPDDHAEAREWVSLFLHEAYFPLPGRKGGRAG